MISIIIILLLYYIMKFVILYLCLVGIRIKYCLWLVELFSCFFFVGGVLVGGIFGGFFCGLRLLEWFLVFDIWSIIFVLGLF